VAITWPDFLRDELGQHGGDTVQHALDVDVDHRVPVVGLHRRERRAGHDPGVEEDHVDAPEAVFCQLHDGVVVGLFGDVEHLPDRLAARGDDLLRQGLETICTPRAQHDFRALRRQQFRGSLANARGRAGDQDDLVFHVMFLSL